MLTIIYSIMILLCILFAVKNEVTYKCLSIISDAINAYSLELIKLNDYSIGPPNYEVDFDDMRSYNGTLFRFWDWGYKNILPKEKYNIIKPYIGKKFKG